MQNMTPKEAAYKANDVAGSYPKEIRAFLNAASSGQIQEFIHLLHLETRPGYYELSKIALSVRISEEQARSAGTLEKYTKTLIKLTWWLVALTVGILILTVYLAIHEWRAN